MALTAVSTVRLPMMGKTNRLSVSAFKVQEMGNVFPDTRKIAIKFGIALLEPLHC